MTEQEIAPQKLWIGNLDIRLTEFQILKFIQKCGNIENFDLPYVRNGTNKGQHRGFAFVTYKSSGDAKHAMDTMNGKIIMGRRVVVKFANKINDEDINNKPDLKISALTGASSNSNRIGRETTIRAIESKLKLMENQSLDVCATFNKPAAGETSLVKNYQYNLNSKPIIEKRSNFDHKYRGYREHKPYTKKK